MRLSGFSVARNAIDLDYPIVEAISSILPIVDEFVIALGDSYDETTEVVRSIADPKLKILERVWDKALFDHGAILAHETSAALEQCSGDWCIYLQADEVIHEKYLSVILEACRKYKDDEQVEGFLLSYKHFWGDHFHYQRTRNWYRREIRVIRNNIGVRSWRSAQGFRIDGRKLNVILIPAEVYHYGWVRDPHKMKKKRIAHDSLHHDSTWVDERYRGDQRERPFEYGTPRNLVVFTGTPPAVMRKRISSREWGFGNGLPVKHKHDYLHVRLLSTIEDVLGTRFGEYRNYQLIGTDDELRAYVSAD
jgi:glycosyltransferase involved in cell wall biosynthesis